jgi:multiple sugar transport system permease protein
LPPHTKVTGCQTPFPSEWKLVRPATWDPLLDNYAVAGRIPARGLILIYLASLQDVPSELLEAAELDGAGSVSRILNVVLPMISPVIFYTLVINLIGYFQYFTEAWVMTASRSGSAGGPANSLMFYAMYLYQNAFQFFRMGYASAQAWILFVIVLAATAVLFRSSEWVYYRSAK